MNESHPRPLIIGWREVVALPDWGIGRIRAKVDTGARSSAIDVAEVHELPDEHVRFEIRLSRTNPDRRVVVTAPIVRHTTVRSSLGRPHDRIIVATIIRIGPVETHVELGLVCRKNMLCRMLLGRRALEASFLVDPARKYVLRRRPTPETGRDVGSRIRS